MKLCNRVLSNDNTVIALSLGILAMYIHVGVDITNFEDGDKEQTMHHDITA